MGKKAPSNVTTTTTTAPPDYLKQPIQDMYGFGVDQINRLSANDMQSPYGDVSPMNQAQLTSQAMQIGRGLEGSPLESGAQGYALNALNGGGMSPYATEMNPYMGFSPQFNGMVDASNQAITDNYTKGAQLDNRIKQSKAGMLGSSRYDQIVADNEARLGSTLADNTRNMFNQQWNQSAGLAESALGRANGAYDSMMGRNNQILGMVPSLAGMDYTNIDRIGQAGDRQFQYSQSLLDSLNNNWQQTRDFGLYKTDLLGGLIKSAMGNSGTSSLSQPRQNSGYGGLLGGLGLAGLSMLGG